MAMVKIIINLKKSFIYNGHLISLGAVGIVLTFIILIEKPISLTVLISVYFLTLISLLHNRYKEQKTDYLTNPERTKSLENYFKKILPITITSFIIIAFLLIRDEAISSFVFLFLLIILIFLYTKFLKNLTNKIIVFKNIIFSLITSSLLIFTAFYYSYKFLSFSFLIIFIFCFLRMMINTIFLDIKDKESDKKAGLKTLPIIFGYEKTILILKIISLFSGLFLALGIFFNFIPIYLSILLIVIPYSFYYFKKSKKEINFYLVNYILADAEFIIWPISAIIGKVIL
jgi:4-hydroxybenzoate polyprenyltransferase